MRSSSIPRRKHSVIPRRRKTTAKTTAAKHRVQVRQSHGGALNGGGTPGNAGGSGRPPAVIRGMARREVLEPALAKMAQQLKRRGKKEISPRDAARFGEVGAKIGLGDEGLMTPEDLQLVAAAIADVAQRFIPPAQHDAFKQELLRVVRTSTPALLTEP